MKVTYVGNTERNGKKRKVTYTGALGPDVMPDKRSPKATYVGVDTSKGSSDGVAWHTNKDSIQANKEYFNPQKQNDYNISALGAGNYGADKRPNSGYNYGKGALKAGGMGLAAIARTPTTILAQGERLAAKGWNALFGNVAPMNERGLFNLADESIAGDQKYLQQKYAENTERGGKYAAKAEELGASAVEALASLVAAYVSGGASTALTADKLAAQTASKSAPTIVQTLQHVVKSRAKDPNYLTSAAQIYSHSYNDAKAEGVDEKKATLYALGNALLGSEIEISGGIQKLPNNVGNQAAWRTLVDTMIAEGKEEVLQGIIDRTLQNVVYDADNPYFGVNKNAIFDPGTAAEEFAGGAIVGGLLSGGTMGVNALANRAAYGAARAQYNRDVRQNTAPEMGSKAAEAVDAVTRGESITGNQAAAIARDPVAVETLEANNGVKLNTEQPLSALKKEIQAVSTRSTARETQTAATPTPAAQNRTQRTVGGFMEAGQKAYQTLRQTADNEADLYAGFSSVYNAGLNGIEASKANGKYADLLTPEQRYAAYNAGLEDARAQLERENAEVASVTTTAGAGLADNEYSRAIIAIHKNTAAVLNSVGKKLGVRIEFVDSVMAGRANGQYIKDKNLIQIAADSDKPYLTVAAHEITHRMQDLSPAEYREFRKAALEYRMQQDGADTVTNLVQGRMDAAARDGVTLTQDEVMDEIAADFAGDMLDDIDLFERFAKDNRTVAQKLLDSLKEFIAKVKAIFTGKARDKAAQEAYGKDFGELEAVAQKWQTAFDAAEQQSRNENTAASEGSGVRFSLKSFSEQAVSTALYDALNEKATRQNQLIPVSIMPRYINEKLGINGDIYIQRDHAYENMVSKAQAIQDGRPTQHKGEEVHFHDLGVEKMTRAIMSINEPIMTISTKTKDGNPAVIMMLPEYGNNDAPLYAVLSFYSRKAISSENREMRPHVVLTIAERNFFENGGRVGWDKLIRNAIKEGRVLDYNKKERGNLSEVAQPAGLGDITDASLKENLTQFQKEVKRFKEGNNIRYQLRSAADVEQEIRDLKRERTALASRNRALEQRVQELKGEMRISKEPSVVARDVKKLGLNTIRQYGSDVNYADIQSDMEALGRAVMKKDVSMADLMPYAKRAAKTIVENTSELTEYGAELLDIRDYLKQQHIRFNGDMAYYEDFRKSHMGTLKLSKTKGTSVDTVYAELTEMFGEGYFPSDVYTEADKLQQIADVIDNTDAIYANPFESYKDAAIQEIANDIIDGMISDQVREKHTFADRKALEKQEAVGRVRNMLDKERQKRKDQVNKLRNQYAEKTAQGRESRKAMARRAQIARHAGVMSNKLLHPTDAKHIPENLRVLVANLLKSINLESAYSLDENGRRRKSLNGDPTKRTQYVRNLQAAYNDIIKREYSMVVDPDLLDTGGLLDQVARLGDKRVADMSSSELEVIWKAIRAIEKTLTTYDKTLSSAKYQSTSEWAGRLAADSISRKRRNRKLSLDMADPYTFFAAYGDAGMQVYRVLRNAQDQEHVMLMELQREAAKFLDKNVYENRFDRHTFTTGRSASLTLTTEQIMNLYNLARRGEQAVNHLMKGGIVQPEIKRNGKLKAIDRGTQNIPLTLDDIQAITSVLTPEQIRVAKGLQKLASSMLAEWGNNASMTVYGYRKFTEEHYWPIKAARDAVSTSIEKDPDNSRSIKNMGSAKALVPDASNALEIAGIYDVFAQNASDMIKYATLLAPMEDINRLYNFRYRDDKGNLTGRNVQQVLSSVYGDAAQKYWRNLMRDMQNGIAKNASDTTRAVERIVSNTKGAAVGANLRVVIQQPTAYCRAAVVLDPAYMAKGLTKGATAGNGWDKARQWAPIAGIKDTSGFDQGSRYTVAREVYGSDGGALEWLNDKSMALAGKADAVTWGKIWNACEWQVASETNLEVGSDEFYRQVAAVFTDVIDQTQVVDGIMQRTQIMRDSDALTRQATSFMGEPLKSLNIFMRAYDAWAYENNPQKRSAALKRLKRSVAALVVTDVVNALAQSIVDGLRDDDKDKNWAERIMEAFTGYSGDEESAGEVIKNVTLGGNLVSNMNPVGRIPYLKDILSILQGYTVDRMDAAAADDIIRTSKTFIKGLGGDSKTTTAYNLKQMLAMGSKVFGISVGNMGRGMWAIARSIANETGNVRLMFEMEKAIYRMDKSAGNRKRWCELLYRAQKDKDTETARLIYKEMLTNGYEEKDVRMGVEAIMKAEQNVKSVKELKNRWRAP